MGLRSFITGIGLVILFSIACFTFMTSFLLTNNPTSEVLNDPTINQTLQPLNDAADSLQDLGRNSVDRLASDEPSAVYFFLIIVSAFALPIFALNFLVTSISTIITMPFVLIFGNGNTNFSVLTIILNGIIYITVAFLVLKAIRTGETE